MWRAHDQRPGELEAVRVGGHDKAGYPPRACAGVGGREDDVEIRNPRVGDEGLPAVQPVSGSVGHRHGRHRRHVGPRLPLRHGKCAHCLARHGTIHPAPRVLPPYQPGRRTQPLQREDRIGQRRPPRQNLPRDQAAAHIPLRDRAEQPRRPHPPHQLPRPHPRRRIGFGVRPVPDLLLAERHHPLPVLPVRRLDERRHRIQREPFPVKQSAASASPRRLRTPPGSWGSTCTSPVPAPRPPTPLPAPCAPPG